MATFAPRIEEPSTEVCCPSCGWRGVLSQCKVEPDSLVECPLCERPVEKEAK